MTAIHRRARDVLDVVVSWPGITRDEVGEELGLAQSTVRAGIAHARRRDWLRSGAIPRLVDLGARWEPDWLAATGHPFRHVAIYRRICRRWVCQLPCRREDLRPYGWTDQQLRDSLYRLRQRGLVVPVDVLYPTDVGVRVAYSKLPATAA